MSKLKNERFDWCFLDASSHLYDRLCPSVGWSVGQSVKDSLRTSKSSIFSRVDATLQPALSVGRSVGRSVGWLVGNAFIKNIKIKHFFNRKVVLPQ